MEFAGFWGGHSLLCLSVRFVPSSPVVLLENMSSSFSGIVSELVKTYDSKTPLNVGFWPLSALLFFAARAETNGDQQTLGPAY